ncbi:MAG: Maf family protein [Moraxella sp.]|nr:Maf family protein [Moraxella sp.]
MMSCSDTLPIILASSSPRRQALLTSAGVAFDVMRADIDESWQAGETAQAYINRMVRQKSAKACQIYQADPINQTNQAQSALILTADTIGVLATGEVLTKPVDKADAFAMWDKLSATTHEIWTAVCGTVVCDNKTTIQKVIQVATTVQFTTLTEIQKERYWATGEPLDKAGAYAIQGGGVAWVRSIHGSYSNVVGLPLVETLELIAELSDWATQSQRYS